MRKLAPMILSAEDSAEINKQLNTQEVSKAQPKSADPVNYPVFDTPVNKKVLIYVPNHVVQDAEGVDRLRMDKPLLHSMTIGKKYPTYRCISGIVLPSHGLNGTCPLCEGCSEPWDLANEIIADKCAQQGLDPEDTDAEAVKKIRSDTFSDRALKDAIRYYTFPIVVFDTVNDDGKTFVKDENGEVVFHIMWYSVSEAQWDKTWAKTLDSIEDEDGNTATHPGGNFMLLNYCYTPKKGEPNKRDSAKNMAVSHKRIKNSEEFRKKLDALTESWTPELAQQYVYNNMIYSPEDLEEVADEALETTRNLLALYQAKKTGNTAGGIAGAQASDGFALEKKEEETPHELDMDTDEDVE